MIGLGCHACTDGTEHGVGNAVNDSSCDVVSLAGGDASDDEAHAREDLQAVIASNQPDIIFIQTKIVPLANHVRGRADSTPRTAKCLQTHAGHGTRGVPTTEIAKVSLAALVVVPARSMVDMIQYAMTHVDLHRTEAEHRKTATTRFTSRCLTHADVILFLELAVLAH